MSALPPKAELMGSRMIHACQRKRHKVYPNESDRLVMSDRLYGVAQILLQKAGETHGYYYLR